jgi:predicted PurR-regulated permease PerM
MKEIELQPHQPPPPPPPGQWSTFTRQMAIVLMILLALLLIQQLVPLLNLLAITGIVILILSYPQNMVRTKTKLPNAAATLVVFLPVAVILFLFTTKITNWLITDIQSIKSQIEGTSDLSTLISSFVGLTQADPAVAHDVLAKVSDYLRMLIQLASSFFFYSWTSLFLAFLFLLEMPSIFRNSFQSLSDVSRREFGILFNRMAAVWNGWLKSTVITSLMIGVFTGLELYILGIPYAGLIGLIAGFLNLIPSIGPLITYIIIILVTYTQGSSWITLPPLTLTILVLGINLLFNQFARLVVFPRMAGKAVRLPVFMIILGLVIGVTLWGVIGAILVIPLLGTIREMLTYVTRKINMQDPFPGEQLKGDFLNSEKQTK